MNKKEKVGREFHLILQLNNYPYNQQVVDDVLAFKTTGNVPAHIKTKARFKKKWTPFYVADNHLIYRPKELKVIIDPNEREEVLKKIFDDERTGVGAGIKQFYYTICSKYLNIKRKDVADFLKRQKVFQMSRNTHHIINKPILATAPNERWAVDMVSMERYKSQNKNYIQILTCIDYFSRYVWAVPVKNETSHDVAIAMDAICRKAGVYPHILQKDNGGSFQGETNTFMEQHNIKWINTLSYSPQSNGLIENFNNQLRKMLRELMIRNKNLVWYNKLDLCCSIKNKQKNGTTKQRPIDIWNDLPYETQNKDLHLPVAQRIKAKAKKNVLKNKTQEFTVGDYVRVKLSQLYSQIRQMVKQGDKKYIVVKYSPEIYEIDRILKPDHEGYEKLRYTLKDLDGNILLTQQKMNNPNKPREQKRFFASDFLKVNKEDIPNDVVKVDDKNHVERDGFDIHQALKLNVIKDAETEAKKPKPPKKVTVKKEKAPVVLREPSARTRTPSTRLVYPSEVEQPRRERVVKEKAPVILREPTARARRPSSRLVYPSEVEGSGFVLIGGQKHLLF